tara:strand:+ start:277 stop:651 length:375 start_codon:yes stop_codon:yes gene_type:complete
MLGELARYASAGFINTLAGYTTILFFQNILNLNPQLSNLLGYICGLFVSFILNKVLVFKRKNGNKLIFFIKFLQAFIFCYLINLKSLNWLLRNDIEPSVSQAIAMISYSIFFYFICKYYVFNGK